MNLKALNEAIDTLSSELKNKSEEIKKKLSVIEDSNEAFRKNLTDKLINIEQHAMDELRNGLNKITAQDNRELIVNIRKLFKDFKTISWLMELSSMGRFLIDILEKKVK